MRIFIKRARFKITVRATDGGSPELYADVDVELDVVDRNNKPPIWEQQFYSNIYAKENAAPGEIVTTVRARLVVKAAAKTDHNLEQSTNDDGANVGGLVID